MDQRHHLTDGLKLVGLLRTNSDIQQFFDPQDDIDIAEGVPFLDIARGRLRRQDDAVVFERRPKYAGERLVYFRLIHVPHSLHPFDLARPYRIVSKVRNDGLGLCRQPVSYPGWP
jgi:hypothetical protein